MSTVIRETSPDGEPQSLKKDVQQICRLCLSEEFLEDIFAHQNDLHTWISDLLTIKVNPNDSISHSICAVCKLRLSEFREYRLQCLEVQDVLRGDHTVLENEKPSPEEDQLDTVLKTTPHQEIMLQYASEDPAEFTEVSNLSVAEYPDGELTENSPAEEPNASTTIETLEVLDSSADENPELEDILSKESEVRKAPGLPCEMCGEIIPKTRMETHMNKHLGFKPYKCERGCSNLFFSGQYNRNWHYQHIHDVPKYRCLECKRSFRSRQGRFAHNQKFHAAKSHRCAICCQAFVTEYLLKKHMLAHGPTEQQFWCLSCDASFPTDYALKRHTAMKHVSREGDDFGKIWLQAMANQGETKCEGELILAEAEGDVPDDGDVIEVDSDPDDLMVVQ